MLKTKPTRSFIYDPSIVLYLPLWKMDGAQFMSGDAYGHLVTRYGALWTPQGHSFDGVDDYLSIPSSSIFLTQQGAVEVIFKSSASGNLFALGKSDAAAPYGFLGTTEAEFSVPVAAFTFTGLTDNVWHHVILQSDSTIITLWVDGNQKTMTLAGGSNSGQWFGDYATDTVAVGVLDRAIDYSYFNGLIAEVIVYNRAFSASEVLNHYLYARRRMPWL